MDHVGELGRQGVAEEPAGALQLGDAVGHPPLELGVPRRQLGRLPLDRVVVAA